MPSEASVTPPLPFCDPAAMCQHSAVVRTHVHLFANDTYHTFKWFECDQCGIMLRPITCRDPEFDWARNEVNHFVPVEPVRYYECTLCKK